MFIVKVTDSHVIGGGCLFYNDNLNTADIKKLYNNQLRPFKSLYDYTSCSPLSTYKDLNGAEVEFVSTNYSGNITNFHQTNIAWDELDEDCYVLVYTNPDDPKNFNRITFMPSKGINYEEYELTNEQNHFHLHKIHRGNYKFSLFFDRVKETIRFSMQDQFGNNIKWDYELYYYQVGFNNPPSASFGPRTIYWPVTNNISPKPLCNYRYHIAGITWEYNIEPPKTYEEFVKRVKDYGLNRLYFDPSEAHIDIPWPSWT